MRIAAISDIHGNLPALDAVLADIAKARVDVTVNLGDILSGPLWPSETADRLMPLKLPTIAGNHERQVLTQALSAMSLTDAQTAPRLRAEHREWLASLPPTLQFGPEVLLCHGTPTSDLQYFMETVVPGFRQGIDAGVRRASLAEAAERAGDTQLGVPHALILCGHTHLPRAMRLADPLQHGLGRLVVNPGSVGLQAFDDDHGHPQVIENATPHARYALLTRTAAGWNVELRAIAYDHEAAARQAESNGRPDWADALRTGFVGRLEPASTVIAGATCEPTLLAGSKITY